MKKLILTILVLCTCILCALADPGTRLGQTLSLVQSEIAGLRHLRNWRSSGDEYIIYHEPNVSTSYYFKNNRVAKEKFTINTNEQNALYYFNRFVADFSNMNYIQVVEGHNEVTFYFSQIKVTVSIKQFIGYDYLCEVTYTYR